jgi:hypothetical protein
VSERFRLKVSPRVLLIVLAGLSAVAVDLWTDWRTAQHRQDAGHGAVTAERLTNVAQGMDSAMLAVAAPP